MRRVKNQNMCKYLYHTLTLIESLFVFINTFEQLQNKKDL